MEKKKHEMTKLTPARVNPVLRHAKEDILSLDGKWCFRLDRKDEGLKNRWFEKPRLFKDNIQVPGCWQGQGFGDERCERVWDFQVDARTLRAADNSTGWYARSFRVPKRWKNKRVWLNFGGLHPSGEVWVNGRRAGAHRAPFVPFGLDVTELVRIGSENHVVVRVSEEGRWLGLSFSWQAKWSGLYRSVELRAAGDCRLERFWIHPDVDREKLFFDVRTAGENRSCGLTVTMSTLDGVPAGEITKKLRAGKSARFTLPVKEPRLWSPDGPNLYRVDAVLRSDNRVMDAVTERVGFVKLSTKGKHFLINDEPYYMRGTGDFAINPETGSPDTDRRRWRKKLAVLRKYGYNHVRCQSYVPTPEYYDAADEVGLIVQGEMGTLGAWGGNTPEHVYAWPKPLPPFRKELEQQWEETVMRDVNHPSAAIYCMSNEIQAQTEFPRTAWKCCRKTKKIKPGALVIWTDGGHNEDLPQDFVNAEATVDKKTRLPVIQHEFRWWSAYPDVRLKAKYKGAVRPYAIEIAERAAKRSGLSRLLPAIAENSNRLQYIEGRTKLEICRRDNPKLAGISHFTATDCGLSPQGTMNEFYGRKYADAGLWGRTNGDTVVLMDRDFEERVLAGKEALRCSFSVSDFSHPPLKNPTLKWKLISGRRVLGSGKIKYRHRPFRTCFVGKMRCVLPEVEKPVAARLEAVLREGKRTFSNHWDFWVFPKKQRAAGSAVVHGKPRHTWMAKLKDFRRIKTVPQRVSGRVILTEELDDDLVRCAERGGRILLAASEGLVRPFVPKLGLSVGRYFFTPPANYPPHENGHGGTIITRHPMLGDLPHEGFADLDLYRLIAESPPVDLEPFGPLKEDPVIRVFSTYFTCHKLGYLMEFKLGKGMLILSALDLDQKLPEARYLLGAILNYASGKKFRTRQPLPEKALEHLLRETKLP